MEEEHINSLIPQLTSHIFQTLSLLVLVIFRSTDPAPVRSILITFPTQKARHNSSTIVQMTMVIDPQSRHYGGAMAYENNMYTNLHAPNFTDPWQHQTSNHGPYGGLKSENRPGMSMQYQQLPPTSSVASTSSYSTQLPQEIPRSTVSYPEQQYSSPATSGASYAPSYPSLNYAQSLSQQQAVQQRKGSEV